nr:hypothetical protein [Limosilactobacillus mucosae]
MTLFDIKYDDFKREDTTNTIVITLYTDDRQPITPDASHTWKAKVSKGDKYVGEYPVTVSGNTIKLSSSNLTRLPNGDYGLELWETYSGSTTIYPSAGVMEFRVHRNANDTLGTVDPTTDINGIIDDLHRAGQNIKVVATNTLSPGSKASVTQSITNGENQLTFYIPQGPKGEQGDVGPAPTLEIGTVTKLNPDQTPTADLTGGNGTYTLNIGIPQGFQGETNATATNALDLANSLDGKVAKIQANGGGRNLLRNSNVELHGKAYDFAYPPLTVDYLEPGETYTMSWYGKVDSNATKHKQDLVAYVFNGNWSFAASSIIPYTTNEYQRNVFTFTVPSNATNVNVIAFYLKHYNDDNSQSQHDKDDDAGIGYVKKYMLEKGTVAHDWQLAPEDVDANVDAKIGNLNTSDRNLARWTSNSWTDYVFATDGQNNLNFGSFKVYLDNLEAGDILTCGITFKNTGITAGQVRVQGSGDVTIWNDGAYYSPYYNFASDIPSGTTKEIVYTIELTHNMIKNSLWNLTLRTDGVPKGGTLSYKCFFAKKGNINTTWSPAPEDIQSEIDALKEAVKKLGGTI